MELWGQYKKGNVTENKTVSDSIAAYQHDRRKLEAPEDDDLSDEQIKAIYQQMGKKWTMV